MLITDKLSALHLVGTNHYRRLNSFLRDDEMIMHNGTQLLHTEDRSISVTERESHGQGLIADQCDS